MRQRAQRETQGLLGLGVIMTRVLVSVTAESRESKTVIKALFQLGTVVHDEAG